jgi:hypothetical protein
MNATAQRLCVWCGPAMIALWGIGLGLVAGMIPLPDPQDSPDEVARMFAEDRNSIRVGLLIVCFGSALLTPFVVAISVQLKRIEGRHTPLASTQLALGALLSLEFIFPIMLMQVAAFRDGRSAEAIQTLNDVAWLLFIGVVMTAVLEIIIIGMAILRDGRDVPIFPRWAGYFNIWVALLLSPGSLCVFFKDGPFAWNGIFCWWVPATVFGIWFAVMTYLLLKAIGLQEREPAEDDAGGLHVGRRMELMEAEILALRAELERVTGRTG